MAAFVYSSDHSGRTYPHDSEVESVAISADGSRIATGGADGKVRVFAFLGNEFLGQFPTHEGFVSGLCMSSSGHILLSSGRSDGIVHIWDVATATRYLPDIKDPNSGVRRLAADDRLTVVATVNKRGHLRVWDIWKRTVRWDRVYGDESLAVAVSGNGRRIACADGTPPGEYDPYSVRRRVYQGSTVFIYDENGAEVSSFQSEKRIWELALSHDGTRVLAGDSSGYAVLYSAAGVKLWRSERHAHQILSVAMDSDCGTVLTGSLDGTARLWKTSETGGLPLSVGRVHHADWVNAVATSSDGSRIVTGSDDGEAYVHEVSSSCE